MAKQHASEKKGRHGKSSLLTKLVILLLLIALGWQLQDLQRQVKSAREEKERSAEQVELQQRENDSLAADIAEGPPVEKVEEIAREELGLVTPNEYVLYDTSN